MSMTAVSMSTQASQQFVSEQARVNDLRPLYLGDGFGVELEGTRSAARGRVTGLSGQGATVALRDASAAGELLTGQPVTLRFLGEHRTGVRTAGTVVSASRVKRSGSEVLEVTVRFGARQAPEASRLAVAAFHQPLASGASSLLGEWLSFRVESFSPGGMDLLAPASGGVVVPGERLALCVMLPTAEPRQVDVEVLQVETDAAGAHTRVHVGLVRPEPRFLEAVSEFLLARAGVSLRQLREAGFPVGDIEKALSFSSVSSPSEMDELLRLRLAAYQSKGKRLYMQDPEEMRDGFDAFSRQLTCRINGVLVASARMTFNDGDLSRSEYVSYGVQLPERVLREGFVEVGRVVTHPDYRGSYIIFRLMQELARVALQSGVRYIIGSATDALGLYERVGFRKLGIQYDAHGMKDVEVIHLDMQRVFREVGVLDVLSWNLIALPIVEAVERAEGASEVLALSPTRRMMLLGHRLSHPLLKRVWAWKQGRRPPGKQRSPGSQGEGVPTVTVLQHR